MKQDPGSLEPSTGRYCRWPAAVGDQSGFPDPDVDIAEADDTGEAVLAGGCFWCVEAVFQRLQGVTDTECGYAGGSADTANYRQVCSGNTGHAEVLRVRYEPRQLSFGAVLKVFFSVAHDPTQWMRQGNDLGPQYRSAVFYGDAHQRRVAQAYIAQLDAASAAGAPLVTRLEPLEAFYPAEPEHQSYADRNPQAGYIRAVAVPKLDKLVRNFAAQTRSNDR